VDVSYKIFFSDDPFTDKILFTHNQMMLAFSLNKTTKMLSSVRFDGRLKHKKRFPYDERIFLRQWSGSEKKFKQKENSWGVKGP
jgi:hypothetical protein